MIVLLLAILFYVAIIAFDAWILTIHVPTIVVDPTNFGAWFWILLVLSFTLIGGVFGGSRS
jgi:hypothetical protein